MDIWDLLTRPEWLPQILAILTGYFLASLFAEDTSFWRTRSSFDKLIISGALGLGLFYAVGYPIILLSSPWTELTTIQQVNQSSGILIFSCFLLVPLSLHAVGISRRILFRAFASTVSLLPYAAILELLLAWLINIEISIYPLYLGKIMVPFWDSFFRTSLICFVLFTLCMLIHQLFITPLQRGRYRHVRLASPGQRSGIKGLKHRLFLFKPSIQARHKIVLLGLAIVIFVPLIVVPIDQHFPFITPRLQIGGECCYEGPYFINELVVARFLEGDAGEYRYYDLMCKEYNITIPGFDSIRGFLHADSVYVANPSNFSKRLSSYELGQTLSNWNNVKSLWISSGENVSFDPKPDENNIDGLIVNFANITNQVINFTIRYYQEFFNRDVSITENVTFRERPNNTKLECYYFIIENKENCILNIPYFEFSRLQYAEVDRNSTKVYINGQEASHVLVGLNFIYPWMIVGAYKTGNLTITLISHQQT